MVFCFICIESAAIVQSICGKTFAIHQKSEAFLSRNFCHLQYLKDIAMYVASY